MDRQTRRDYFERLCELRVAYGRRRADDTTAAITIDAMLERATRLLEHPASPLIVMLDRSAPSA